MTDTPFVNRYVLFCSECTVLFLRVPERFRRGDGQRTQLHRPLVLRCAGLAPLTMWVIHTHYAQFVPHDDWGRNELWPLQRVVFFWQQSTKRTRTPRMIILLCASLTPSFQGILLGAADGDEVAVGLAMEVAVGLAVEVAVGLAVEVAVTVVD